MLYGTVWSRTFYSMISSRKWYPLNVEPTTVSGAGAVSRSRQHFGSKHPDMSSQCHIFSRPSSSAELVVIVVVVAEMYPQSSVKCIAILREATPLQKG